MKKEKEILQGSKLAFPIVLGYLPLGFAFGVLAVKNGIPPAIAILMSLCVFAGSGQFIAASLIGGGASIFTICFTNFIVNLRYMLMSAALAPHISNLSKAKRAMLSFEITDEVFAVHSASFKTRLKVPFAELISTNIVAHIGWIFGTALGALSSELVADVKPFGLDFALTAMFIALLVPMCSERIYMFMAILSGIFSVSLAVLGINRWNVIVATIIAALIGAVISIRQNSSSGQINDEVSDE